MTLIHSCNLAILFIAGLVYVEKCFRKSIMSETHFNMGDMIIETIIEYVSIITQQLVVHQRIRGLVEFAAACQPFVGRNDVDLGVGLCLIDK